jgi:hypothetical protein
VPNSASGVFKELHLTSSPIWNLSAIVLSLRQLALPLLAPITFRFPSFRLAPIPPTLPRGFAGPCSAFYMRCLGEPGAQ